MVLLNLKNMTLIKSISGIRGTIGGAPGDALTPIDIVKFTYAYSERMKQRRPKANGERYKVVVGKDARISGEMVEQLVCGTLLSCGVDVVNAGFASTPTVEMAVVFEDADGGIILTASHNPKQWNALKLLDEKGEFLNAKEGAAILACAEKEDFNFSDVDSIGVMEYKDFTDAHIDAVLSLETVDVELVKSAGFKVVVDAVNSVGGIIMPRLLHRMGVECVELNCEPTGEFAHNPEPLPENLVDLSNLVLETKADFGVSVDPDVDRLALICEDGEAFGEEYTLVVIADYLLSRVYNEALQTGKTMEEVAAPYLLTTSSNLSSSRALRDITEQYGGEYFAAAVGEVNVVTKMKEKQCIFGGEGNGGVIYPALHYGRDAIVGVALFLTYLANKKCKVSELRASYPQYVIVKNKIELADKKLIDQILEHVKITYASEDINTIDGVKISFEEKKKWVHLRRSNTEPIIRIYAEAPTEDEANALAQEIIDLVNKKLSK